MELYLVESTESRPKIPSHKIIPYFKQNEKYIENIREIFMYGCIWNQRISTDDQLFLNSMVTLKSHNTQKLSYLIS